MSLQGRSGGHGEAPGRLRAGVDLFRAGRFFDAHEALEDAWRAADGATKIFLQGLVQVAVAMHHFSVGNLAGATSVLRRAAANLERCPSRFCGLDIDALRAGLAEWNAAFAADQPPPAPPKLQWIAGAEPRDATKENRQR